MPTAAPRGAGGSRSASERLSLRAPTVQRHYGADIRPPTQNQMCAGHSRDRCVSCRSGLRRWVMSALTRGVEGKIKASAIESGGFYFSPATLCSADGWLWRPCGTAGHLALDPRQEALTVHPNDTAAAKDRKVCDLATPAANGLRIDADELGGFFDCHKQRRRVRTRPRFTRTRQPRAPVNALLANGAPERAPQSR